MKYKNKNIFTDTSTKIFPYSAQNVPSNSETNLEETLWKISFKNETIHQNDVLTELLCSFSTLL